LAAPDIQVVRATEAHAREMAERMTPEEAAEVQATYGVTPLRVAILSIASSEAAWAITVNGELAVLLGVSPASAAEEVMQGSASAHVLWAHTTAVTGRHPKAFLRASRAVLEALLKHYPTLLNNVDARRTSALRWARWLGFEVGPPIPASDGRTLCSISIRRT
jgi:hypothetical protein